MEKNLDYEKNIFCRIKEFIIANYLLIFIIAIQFICYLIYIQKSCYNVIFMDQIRMTELIDKYNTGRLLFSDVWEAYLTHRILGSNVIFLINAILFKLNTFVEIYMGAVSIMLTIVLIFKNYVDSFPKKEKLFITLFSLISFIMFGLNAWETIVLSLGAGLFIRILFFTITFMVFNYTIKNDNNFLKNNIKLSFSIIFSILVLGAAYTPAFIGALIVTLIIDYFINLESRNKNLKVMINIVMTMIISMSIYLYKMDDVTNNSIMLKIKFIFAHIVDAIQFYIVTTAGSVLGGETALKYLNNNLIVIIGILILFTYIFSMYIFISKKMYTKTYIPMLFIIYALFIQGLVLIGRFDFGANYGLSSRYAGDTRMGIIAVIWILLWNICEEKSISLKKLNYFKTIPSILIISMILILNIVTNIDEWEKAPHRKMYFQNLEKIAYNIDNATPKELELFQYDSNSVKKSITTLRKYNLNIFASSSSLDKIQYLDGWYEENEKHNWMKNISNCIVNSGEEGVLYIKAYVPEEFGKDRLSIFVENEKVYDTEYFVGVKDIKINIPKNKQLKIKLVAENLVIPYKKGLGEDVRELSIFIANLDVR